LRAAEHFNREIGTGKEVPAAKQEDRLRFRKKLDDSRYEDN
jgi:hypothetical protein